MNVVIHDDILSIVPKSKEKLYETQNYLQLHFSPTVILEPGCKNDLPRQKEESFNKILIPVKNDPLSVSILGDDADYVSLQYLSLLSEKHSSTSKKLRLDKISRSVMFTVILDMSSGLVVEKHKKNRENLHACVNFRKFCDFQLLLPSFVGNVLYTVFMSS